jgi:Tfp pilus assembly protein PilX
MIRKFEKGVSLIITFFIMVIILTVVLSISVLLYSEIKVIRNIGNSVVAFYAADSGIEKTLYYARKDAPTGAKSGICYACNHGIETCTTIVNTDCADSSCANCEVRYSGSFDGRSYIVDTTISPNGNLFDFTIDSAGSYSNVNRKIELSTEIQP